YSFELEHFSEYCRLGDLLDQYNKQLAWGPGRHRPGDNVYADHVDVAGAMVECSSGMALIDDDDNYQPNIITAIKRPENARALSFIAAREEVDPARIGVIGHSFGAAVALYTAGIDGRFACVISSCGWGDGERKFRGQHPTPEAWAKFTGILERGRKHKAETGESMWVSRFDVVPI